VEADAALDLVEGATIVDAMVIQQVRAASSNLNRLIFAVTGTPLEMSPSRTLSRSRAVCFFELCEDSPCR
jgi:hypothetical protein